MATGLLFAHLGCSACWNPASSHFHCFLFCFVFGKHKSLAWLSCITSSLDLSIPSSLTGYSQLLILRPPCWEVGYAPFRGFTSVNMVRIVAAKSCRKRSYGYRRAWWSFFLKNSQAKLLKEGYWCNSLNKKALRNEIWGRGERFAIIFRLPLHRW